MKKTILSIGIRALLAVLFFLFGFLSSILYRYTQANYSALLYEILNPILLLCMSLTCGFEFLYELKKFRTSDLALKILAILFAFLSVAHYIALYVPFGIVAHSILKACQPISIAFTAFIVLYSLHSSIQQKRARRLLDHFGTMDN